MKVFMISDTHFGDERILRYENRPFSSVEEMDKAIIENWNQVVGEEDTVFHLGDVSSYDPERNKEILSSLHGKKILVMGNHDQNYTPRQWDLTRQLTIRSCFVSFLFCPIHRCISAQICPMPISMGMSTQIPVTGMLADKVPVFV